MFEREFRIGVFSWRSRASNLWPSMSSEEKLFPCLFSRYFSPRCFAPNFNLAFNRAYNFSLRHPFDTPSSLSTRVFLLTRSICQRQMCNSVTKISNLPSADTMYTYVTDRYKPSNGNNRFLGLKSAYLVFLLETAISLYSKSIFAQKFWFVRQQFGLSMSILLRLNVVFKFFMLFFLSLSHEILKMTY